MKINLVPQRRDDRLILEKRGDALTINGIAYDFSPLEAGGTLPEGSVDCEYIVGDVERTAEGELKLSLLLLYSDPNAPESVRFPEPLVDVQDGVVELPL